MSGVRLCTETVLDEASLSMSFSMTSFKAEKSSLSPSRGSFLGIAISSDFQLWISGFQPWPISLTLPSLSFRACRYLSARAPSLASFTGDFLKRTAAFDKASKLIPGSKSSSMLCLDAVVCRASPKTSASNE